MRRVLLWHLPVGAALVATAVFAFGLITWLRGDTGTPVEGMVAAPAAVTAPQAMVAPVILGDSLARGAGDETGLGIAGRLDDELRRRGVRARRTYNVAVNGARTKDLLEVISRPNVQQMLRESNVVILSIGGNDLWGGNDWRNAAPPDPDAAMGGVLTRIEEVITRVRALNPRARIFFVGLYNPFVSTPMGTQMTALVHRWNARLIDEFRADSDFTVVQTADIFSHRDRLALDRFHPNGEAYGLIARRIADGL